MQDKRLKQEYVLIAVPEQLLLEAGIFESDAILMYVSEDRLVIEHDDEEFICDGDCEDCPMSDMDCDGECDACPCSESCDESEVD